MQTTRQWSQLPSAPIPHWGLLGPPHVHPQVPLRASIRGQTGLLRIFQWAVPRALIEALRVRLQAHLGEEDGQEDTHNGSGTY